MNRADMTKEGFDYQWAHLAVDYSPEDIGRHKALVLEYTKLPEDWFKGKKVIDVGCGGGRFTCALGLLGADLTACDQSKAGLDETYLLWTRIFRDEIKLITLYRADILRPMSGEYDLVWCFGVVHHTGDTFGAIWNLMQIVKPGGYLFLMVYGRPTDEKGRAEVEKYETIRNAVADLPYPAKVAYLKSIGIPDDKLHGWFDATTPKINDLYHYGEIEAFMKDNGFSEIKNTSEGNRNIRIIGRKQ